MPVRFPQTSVRRLLLFDVSDKPFAGKLMNPCVKNRGAGFSWTAPRGACEKS